jgi:gamma-glutamylcyclotransferase (GGCT)/AIG2-like uncharacterized protein YtfP
VTKVERKTMPATVVDRLFVYGTMRAGQSSRAVLASYVKSAVPATTRGTMYAFPSGHPGVVPDDAHVVVGELVHLDDLASALPLLDAFEGNDFMRILVEVAISSGPGWAWIYVLASPELATIGIKVTHGDWPRYLEECERSG